MDPLFLVYARTRPMLEMNVIVLGLFFAVPCHCIKLLVLYGVYQVPIKIMKVYLMKLVGE